MKSAICTINWRFEKKLPDILALAGPIGFKGIEIWMPHLASSAIGKARDLCQEFSLTPVCLSVPFGLRFWEQEKAILAYAASLPFQGIKIFGDEMDDWTFLVRTIKQFCKKVADNGKEVYIENHSGQPHDTVEHTLRLFEDVNEGNFRLVFDIWNSEDLKEDCTAAFNAYRSFIHHIHLKHGARDPSGVLCGAPASSMPGQYLSILQDPAMASLFCSAEIVYRERGELKEIRDFIEETCCL